MEDVGSYLVNGKKNKCCGCKACEQACPVNCISMKYESGFFYPGIDTEKCIECGKCIKVCQFSDIQETVQEQQVNVYAGWSKDVIDKSTSGAIFPVLAKAVIERGGYVFGAVFNKEFDVNMIGTCNMEDVEKMKGSKYIRSDTRKTYSEVKNLLEVGNAVLYSGTPCQISGLRHFLGKTYENLFCIDLICHGVPTEIMFRKYRQYLEKKQNSLITDFRFRNKKQGVMGSEYYIKFENGTQMREPLNKNKYSLMYNSLIGHMPSCYSCPYASMTRISDITIGDFWGIEKYNKDAANEKGTSVIITNTVKGKQLLETVSHKLVLIPETMEHAQMNNPALFHSIKKHPMSEKFIRDIETKSFDKVYKKYIFWGNKWMLLYRIARKIKSIVKK